ncbi:MAG: hypothetical protein K2H46_06925 [Muribaculaceae bacterium]|nr:hypothetical protein [Muribaculaceae bacterium]
MEQIVLNIEDKKLLPYLKKVLSSINGVSIAKPVRRRKGSLDIALEEVKEGKIKHFENVDDLFTDLGI